MARIRTNRIPKRSARPGHVRGTMLATLILSAVALMLWGSHQFRGVEKVRPVTFVSQGERVVHYVSPDQLTASAAATNRPIFRLADPVRHAPEVIIFIKIDCPCSVEFEPFYHRLQAAYVDVAQFRGVIDGDREAANRFAADNHSPYPILADADGSIAAEFGAEAGAYVALMEPPGTIKRLWPGLSRDAFRQMGGCIAAAAGVAERPLDLTGLPDTLVTGCPYSVSPASPKED